MNTAFTIKNQHLQLLCEKALFWEEQRWLIVADVHLGKTTHFRRNGLAVPKAVADTTLNRLSGLIDHVNPVRVIFLGDLFHSTLNGEWNLLLHLVDTFHDVRFTLIEGNHDILDRQLYADAGLEQLDVLNEGPFCFTHHPEPESSGYNICGHIHPAVELQGKARQVMKFPCFFFGEHLAILPAFGDFTGTHILRPSKEDQVFVCAKSAVIAV